MPRTRSFGCTWSERLPSMRGGLTGVWVCGVGNRMPCFALLERSYKQLRLQKRRLVRWLQDKAVELAHEDLARVQAAMMDSSRMHSARYSDEASYM